jgi:hypothetical protein
MHMMIWTRGEELVLLLIPEDLEGELFLDFLEEAARLGRFVA